MRPLRFELASEFATAPFKGSKDSAGIDLASAENLLIPSGERDLVSTGVAFQLPLDTYGKLEPRSGLAARYGVHVEGAYVGDNGEKILAGIIDCDYTGVVAVVLLNTGEHDFKICRGDRIAQMIVKSYVPTHLIEVDNINDTERGEDGFGSTGK